MAANVQHIRLSKPDPPKSNPPKLRHQGILQDQLRRTARAPWTPSLSLAFRMILLLRFSAAMYSNIQDCDEVYNFWEPLHYLDRGFAFQTWELSPQYAIRSWTYIVFHLLPVWLSTRLLSLDKRQVFFAVRICLAVVTTYCEAKFYRTVSVTLNDRVGRYMLFMLLFSAGMWNASTAFLPSSFAMYANTFASAYFFQLPSMSNNRRTLLAVLAFATGAIVGWPFSLLVSVPFVIEELFVYGLDRIPPELHRRWQLKRLQRLITCGLAASAIFIPVVFIDSTAYGKLVITPWNIIKYNIFGGAERGPDLYGSEPFSFYFLNLLLNFNIVLPLALLSLPSLFVTYVFDRKRLGLKKPGPDQSSPVTLIAVRLMPMYLWLFTLSAQPHKEERFMFPIYPFICFNASVTLYLVKGWMEASFIAITKSPYRASKSPIFRTLTTFTIVSSIALSVSRILALQHYYHAPLDVVYHFEAKELPRLLNVTGLINLPSSSENVSPEELASIDLSSVKELNLRVCLGKEWYRFPGHYLVPDGVDVQFIKSEFNGLLPRNFLSSSGQQERLWKRDATKVIPSGLNDMNKEEKGQYVDVSTCDYLIDLDFPEHPRVSAHEPRYAVNSDVWDRVFCTPFLDAAHSSLLTRTLWLPTSSWSEKNSFGDYCLLRDKRKAFKRENIKN